MKLLLGLVCTLNIAAVGSETIAGTYQGRVGSNGAKARLDFAGGLITGALCVEKPGLNLGYDIYKIGGRNPEGRIDGRLLSNEKAAGSLTAVKRTESDEIIWEGTASIKGTSNRLRLTRRKSDTDDDISPENEFRFGRTIDGYQGFIPDQLTVNVPIAKYDAAISLLNSIPEVTKITIFNDSIHPIYDLFLDECERSLHDFASLSLTVDAFLLKETYDKLVSSKLFTMVRTEDIPLGPESLEIPIPMSLVGSKHSEISNFLDMLVERYFGRLRNSQDACRKHGSRSVFATPQEPSSGSDDVEIDRLETNKFYFRRFSILGLSKNLVFGIPNHWEHYIIELKLHPSFNTSAGSPEKYTMEITFSTGEIAPFQEGSKPPVERFKPIPDDRLQTFAKKYSACLSEYVTGACPSDWDVAAFGVAHICGRDQ